VSEQHFRTSISFCASTSHTTEQTAQISSGTPKSKRSLKGQIGFTKTEDVDYAKLMIDEEALTSPLRQHSNIHEMSDYM
jgi:hypothetical protein